MTIDPLAGKGAGGRELSLSDLRVRSVFRGGHEKGRPRAPGTALLPDDWIFSSQAHQARSKRSAFITLVHAATKSLTNFCWASSWA